LVVSNTLNSNTSLSSGYGATINANITASSISDQGNVVYGGNINSSGSVSLGYSSKVTGSVSAASLSDNGTVIYSSSITTSGNVSLGYGSKVTSTVTANNISDNGNVTYGGALSGSNNINVGNASNVAGTVTSQSGNISIGQNCTINGTITSGGGNISVDQTTHVSGSLITTSGDISVGLNDTISGSLTNTQGNITVGQGATVTGSINNTSGNITTGYTSVIGGSINTENNNSTSNSNDSYVNNGNYNHYNNDDDEDNNHTISIGQGSSIAGNISANTDSISIGYAATVNGALNNNSGSITINQSGVVNQSIISISGAISVGYGAKVTGSITTGGSISFSQNSIAASCVTSTNSQQITLGYQASINSLCCGSSCGTSCVRNSSNLAMPQQCSTGTTASLVSQYHFEESSWNGTAGEVKDSSGNGLNGTAIGSPLPTPATTNAAISGSTGTCGYASLPGPDENGGAFLFNNLPVVTSNGAQTSVAFWLYWDGNYGRDDDDGVMPLGWANSDLWLSNNAFGFNTAQGDIFGINFNNWSWQSNFNWWNTAYSADNYNSYYDNNNYNNYSQIPNQWHHIVAIFNNGNLNSNQLYIDGNQQSLNSEQNWYYYNQNNVVSSALQMGGWTRNSRYRFSGYIDELQIYNGSLTASQITALAQQTHSCATAQSTPASFNAFDTSTAATATTGYIQTKVAGTSFSLDVVALNSTPSKLTSFANAVKVELVDASTSSSCATMTNIQTVASSYTFSTSDAGRHTFSSITQDQAYKNVKARISYPATSPTSVVCSNDNFAIRPSSFGVVVSDSNASTAGTIRTLSASSATGTPTHKAGQPLTLTITPYNSLGTTSSDITTNYTGSPVTSVSCALPSSCNLGSFSPGTLTFNSGIASSTTANYSEVGVIYLTVSDASFAAVDASDGSTSSQMTITSGPVTVGRFTPDHFDVSLNSPVFSPADGTFTYIGQPITYATIPVATVTAKNASGVVTQNYTGSFFNISPTSSSYGITPTYTEATLSVSTLNSQAPVAADKGSGVSTLSFANTSTNILSLVRPSSPIVNFNANIALSFSLQDTDGIVVANVNSVSTSNPIHFGTAAANSGISFTNGANSQYWGRLGLSSAHGSELSALSLAITAQYFNGTTFITNTADNSTSLTLSSMFSLTNPTTSNGAAQLGTASMNVGSGTSSASLVNNPLSNGLGYLSFSSPGAGNTGYIYVTSNFASSLPWLIFNWNQNGAGNTSPYALATFGVYQGNKPTIFFKEVY
jgi:hypothetical protein